ncbi:Fic family protein [[Pseudomonas] hibiscicola]|nr:Fic family protein [Stenotrophomonas sp. Sm10]
MKVRYGLPESSVIGLRGCDFVLPDGSDHSSGRRFREMFARVLSCRLRHCPECSSITGSHLGCRRGDAYLKSAGKCGIQEMHARSLISMHSRFAADSAGRSDFRVRRVWVGAEGAPHSFVAAQIDVQSHLSKICGSIAEMKPAPRLYALLLAIDILHPFEDGNGRLMRGLACAFAVQYRCDFFAFLAVYIKVAQDDFVHALEMAADDVPLELHGFHARAVEKYQCLMAEPGGFERWLDESVIRKGEWMCGDVFRRHLVD